MRIREDERSEGFSLIELAIVLACLCIVVSIAVPCLSRLNQEWRLWCGTWVVEGSLQWGRMYSISSNAPLALEIEPGGRRFYWADPSTGKAYGHTIRDLPVRVRIVSSPAQRLRYFPKGNAAPAGTLVLQGETGRYRVIVNPAGRIRVQRE